LATDVRSSVVEAIDANRFAGPVDVRPSLAADHIPRDDRVAFNAVYVGRACDGLAGGDWFDVFAIRDGRLCISIGDVAGHSFESARVMTRVKRSIRSLSRTCATPTQLLHRLDGTLRCDHFGGMVTAFLGYLDPGTRTLTYANAGHPPPIVRRRNGAVTMFDVGDIPLGLGDLSKHRVDKTVSLDPGSLLVLFTDGLTEASRRVLDGERLVCDAVRSDAVAHARNPADALRRRVIPHGSHDDVAILTAMLT
jgi:serine phosphatase RsbU (regulator of sigma subunit)